ncbi:exosome component 10 isoform X1 [Schistocerca serialis cubense]|uniref:exosome component 10 isoform X1 n=1 Tax=Schistocerca serialis cubense TaxID=2023355 RepID=UPI00214EB41F|nr:exosome component 10 isoform X1 [Schistocerca serialis cubense]
MENKKKRVVAPSVKENGVEEISMENEVSTNTNAPDILPGFKTMDEFLQTGFRAAMEATKLANRLPSGHKWDIYTSYPSFQRLMDGEANQMMQILSMILRHQGIGANVVHRDVEEKFDLVVEANDAILERVGLNLDELAGIRRNPEPVLLEAAITRPVSAPWNSTAATEASPVATVVGSGQTVRLLTARNIERPQAKFKDKVDNSPGPFQPILKYKPNAITPFAITLEVTDEGERFCHPYEYELDRLRVPPQQLERVPAPQKPLPVDETPLVVVERPEDVHIMLEDLRRYTEVAVDLEHHSYRSYQGLTCLMQLSTRDTDYIVDTLALRSDLQCLNDVFTDPKVVKVLHGADSDVEWLQRDLGLYLVNLFDTHQAARVLGLAHLSLAFVLKHYCHVTADKHYQLADWRIRPLPEELVKYAREDTHYLLYVYDLMKNELLERANGNTNLLLSVIQRSTEICKKRYEKPVVTEHSHMELFQRHKKLLDNRQQYALRELFRWRDKMARQEDESIGYVLPNHMLLQISEVLPREMQGILACCNPIPPLVRQHLNALHQIVLKARDQPLVRPVLEEERLARPAAQTQFLKANLEGPLLCPHDLSHAPDFRDDLPCLLGAEAEGPQQDQPLSAAAPAVTVFDDADAWADEAEEELPARVKQVRFVSPYARYLRVRPYTQELEAEAAAAAATAAEVTAPETAVADGTVTSTPTKREVIKDEVDTSTGPPTLDSPNVSGASGAPVSSPEGPPSLKRERKRSPDTEADSGQRRPKYQPMPDQITIESADNDSLLPSGKNKKRRKKKKGKANAAATPAAADAMGAGNVEKQTVVVDGGGGGDPELTGRRQRSVAGPKHPRDGGGDRRSGGGGPLEEELQPTPPKQRKLQHQQQPQPIRSQRGDTAESAGPVGSRGRGQSRGRGSGRGRGGGRGSGAPGPSEVRSGAEFRPFDYSQVDYQSRFKGGSKSAGVAKDGANSKRAKGKKGKAMFAGKMNQKSITFAKKLL